MLQHFSAGILSFCAFVRLFVCFLSWSLWKQLQNAIAVSSCVKLLPAKEALIMTQQILIKAKTKQNKNYSSHLVPCNKR